MLDTKTRTTEAPANQVNVKWKNLHFDKHGASHYGNLIHATEEDAKKVLDKAIVEITTRATIGIRVQGGYILRREDLVWTMQIPIIDKE